MTKQKRIDGKKKRLPLTWFLLFVLFSGLFLLMAHQVVIGKKDWFDSHAFEYFRDIHSPVMTEVFGMFSFFGSNHFLLPAYVIIVLILLLKKRKNDARDVAFIGLSSTALLHGMKALFQRKRPDMPLMDALTNYSFPSGHALSSMVFCVILIGLVRHTRLPDGVKWILNSLLVVFALMIGLSRIVLRFHYASDVVAGFTLAIAWVFFCLFLKHLTGKEKTVQKEKEYATDSRANG